MSKKAKLTILFASANPAMDLNLDNEHRVIIESIQKSSYVGYIDVVPLLACRYDDLIDAMNRVKPDIIHFAGHGTGEGGLVFSNPHSNTTITINKNTLQEKEIGIERVSGEILKDIFATAEDNLKLVVLNTCLSEAQAKQIIKEIDFVIGMNTTIGDSTATIFAKRFYQSLASDVSIKDSFKQAKTQVKLEAPKETQTPMIFTKGGAKDFKISDIVDKSLSHGGSHIIHSGSGDIVGRDKIINPPNPHIVPKMLTRSGQESLLNYVVQESLVEKIEKDLLNHSIVWIQGFGGMGKSALASHYFNLHHHRYEYVAMFKVGLDIASNFATNLKDPLQLPFGSARELFGIAINRLSNLDGKKLLIVDDVQNLKEQLPLLEEIIKLRHSGFEIIFTSREQYDSIEPMVLEGLPIQKARELFTIHYPSDEIEKIDKIIHYLDFHTYFIKLTAIALKKQSHTVTLESIYHDFETKRLGEMSSGDQESFYDLLDRLFDNKTLLEDETNLLFLKRLAIFPSTQISFEELKTLLFYSEEVLEEMLNRLTSHGWIIQTADGYKLHQILKRYLLESYDVEFGQISQTVKFLTQMLERMNQLFDASTKELESMEDIVQTRELNLRYLYLSFQIPHILANNLTSDISLLLVEQAEGYNNYGEYSKALKLLIVIKNIYEHVHGKKHTKTATIYNNIGIVYDSIGEYDKALEFYQKSLAIVEEVLSMKHPNTASSYNNIGGVYYAKGEYDKALEFYQKSLAIDEEVLGIKHHSTATSYNNIGMVYYAKGEYDKALEFYQKSLAMIEEVLGTKHPLTATSYNNIAIFYYNIQNYQESVKYMQKAVDIREMVLPANHPDLISSKEWLVTIKAML